MKSLPVDEDDQRIDCCGCCNITREHIEAFLYWFLLCCSRRKDGRKDISYRQYQPLRTPKRRSKKKQKDSSLEGEVEEDDFDEGASVLSDGTALGNAQDGHNEGGHWLRNLLISNKSILK
jgi:hypothetical protein